MLWQIKRGKKMNYSDQILENKAFNFFKQLMYNLALSICIMLVGVLILVYGFKFRLYEVLSWSQEPYFTKGDMVIVKPQDTYKEGDIIKFNHGKTPTTHRLVLIHEEAGKTYYICHGDNVEMFNSSKKKQDSWEEQRDAVVSYLDEHSISDLNSILIQVIQLKDIEGKVINHIDNWGTYFAFIKEHWMLFIAIIGGIWCVSTVVQNEIDYKKSVRLL